MGDLPTQVDGSFWRGDNAPGTNIKASNCFVGRLRSEINRLSRMKCTPDLDLWAAPGNRRRPDILYSVDSSFKEAQNSNRMDNSEPRWSRARRGRLVIGMIGQIGITAAPLRRAERSSFAANTGTLFLRTAVPDGVPVKMTGMEQLTLFVQPIS